VAALRLKCQVKNFHAPRKGIWNAQPAGSPARWERGASGPQKHLTAPLLIKVRPRGRRPGLRAACCRSMPAALLRGSTGWLLSGWPSTRVEPSACSVDSEGFRRTVIPQPGKAVSLSRRSARAWQTGRRGRRAGFLLERKHPALPRSRAAGFERQQGCRSPGLRPRVRTCHPGDLAESEEWVLPSLIPVSFVSIVSLFSTLAFSVTSCFFSVTSAVPWSKPAMRHF
jgi:hypothetical protein